MLTSHRAPSHLNPQILAIRLVPGPGDLAIVHTHTRDIAPRPKELESHSQGITVSDNLNRRIRATPISQLEHPLLKPLLILQIIPGLRSQLLRERQPILHPIDRQQRLRLIIQSIHQRTQPDRPAPNQDHNATRDRVLIEPAKRIRRRKISRREDISHEDELLLVDVRRRLDDGRVRERDAAVLGLATVEDGAPEELALLAARREPLLAVEALSAVDREGRHDQVAFLDGFDVRACFDYLARELVAHDEARWRRLVASEDVQFAVRWEERDISQYFKASRVCRSPSPKSGDGRSVR